MSKIPKYEPENPIRPDPTVAHPPIDPAVKLPRQVRAAAARAEELIMGKRTPPVERGKTRLPAKLAYSNAHIDEILERWDRGDLKVTDTDFGIIIELAREAARLTKAHRRGARATRKTSTEVTRRLQALIQAYSELSPKLQAHPTGRLTIERLRNATIQKLGLPDDDDLLSEDTIRRDIRQIRPLIRLVQKGVIPPIGTLDRHGLSEETRREMEAGRAALARIATASTSPEPLETSIKRDDES